MIYVFLGNEVNLVLAHEEELLNKLNISNIIKYDYNECVLNDVLDEACFIDLFNEKKLIIVNNFTFKKLKDKEEEKFIRFINSDNENVIIFKCIEEKLDDRKSLTKLIKEKCQIIECKKLDYKALSKLVTDMFLKENINIEFNEVKKILDLCEYNTDKTIMEVKKLLLYKIGEIEVTEEDIIKVVSKSSDKELFTLTENILKKDIGACINSYNILINNNIDTTIILDSIAKQFRLLFQLKGMYGKFNEGAISNMLEVNPYTIKKLFPFINSYKKEEILDILVKLSDMDNDIKVNGYDKNKVMEMFFLTI